MIGFHSNYERDYFKENDIAINGYMETEEQRTYTSVTNIVPPEPAQSRRVTRTQRSSQRVSPEPKHFYMETKPLRILIRGKGVG